MVTEPTTPETYAPTALPSVGARVVAFALIVLAGVVGAFIGYAFTDLQCEGDCTAQTGMGALVGAALCAGGVAVVTVLALRAMGEWKIVQRREEEAAAAAALTADQRRRPPRVR